MFDQEAEDAARVRATADPTTQKYVFNADQSARRLLIEAEEEYPAAIALADAARAQASDASKEREQVRKQREKQEYKERSERKQKEG